MLKIIGFPCWIGCFIYSIVTLVNYFMDPGDIWTIVGVLAMLQLSGIGRRLFYIKKDDIEDEGFFACLFSRIFSMRFWFTIIKNGGALAAFYGVLAFGKHDLLKSILFLGIGIIVSSIGNAMMKYTCSHCGRRLSSDDEDYDNDIEIESTQTSSTAYRYSTEYLHCPRCGHRSRIRHKNQIASVNYR